MRKTVLIGFVVLASAFLCVSCATILRDTTQDVTINSTPDGATVRIDGVIVGETPLTVSLETSKSYTVELSKVNYPTRYATLSKSVSYGWVLTDLLTSSIVGVVVDFVTDSIYKLTPASIDVELKYTAPKRTTTQKNKRPPEPLPPPPKK